MGMVGQSQPESRSSELGRELRQAGGPGTKEQESLQTSKDNYLTCESEPKDTRINKLKSKRLSQTKIVYNPVYT